MSDHSNDDEIDLPTVEQLEEALTADPRNIQIEEELTEALLNRYYYEGEAKQDMERLSRLVAKMPKDRALFARACKPGSTTRTMMQPRNSMRVPFI